MQTLTITTPDDWHLHFRDNEMLAETVPATARCFQRAIVMPNLVPPVVNAEMAMAYKGRIEAARPKGSSFEPLMTLFLTNQTTPQDIIDAKQAGVTACKLYPAGATTNSDAAVKGIQALYPVFQAMQEQGLLLLIHGEVTEHHIDIFDREKVYIDRTLKPIVERFTKLKIVLEHITTKDAVDFVKQAPANVGATITAHHLLFNRNHMLVGGIRPHYFCLPILKRNIHQNALIEAATSGNAKFFLGTDSAPHPKHAKESACGCAGSYTAHAAIELYAEVFEHENALDKLEAFASFNGPDFYGLPRNTDTITLTKAAWDVPETMAFGSDSVVPIRAGEQIQWSVSE